MWREFWLCGGGIVASADKIEIAGGNNAFYFPAKLTEAVIIEGLLGADAEERVKVMQFLDRMHEHIGAFSD